MSSTWIQVCVPALLCCLLDFTPAAYYNLSTARMLTNHPIPSSIEILKSRDGPHTSDDGIRPEQPRKPDRLPAIGRGKPTGGNASQINNQPTVSLDERATVPGTGGAPLRGVHTRSRASRTGANAALAVSI